MARERINARFDSPVEKRLYQDGKVGAGAGWTVRAAADSWLSTVAASQTGATLVIPLPGLARGDLIRGFSLIGQVESAGGNVTITAALYKSTAVAADVSTAAVTGYSLTVATISADAILSESNALKLADAANRVIVGEGETYFLLVTATTAASTDIALQGALLHVEPNR